MVCFFADTKSLPFRVMLSSRGKSSGRERARLVTFGDDDRRGDGGGTADDESRGDGDIFAPTDDRGDGVEGTDGDLNPF